MGKDKIEENDLIEIKFKYNKYPYTAGQQPTSIDCEVNYINSFTGENLTGKGLSCCHPKDQFQKEKGRKLALRRAIVLFPKNARTEVWNAYHNRTLRIIG